MNEIERLRRDVMLAEHQLNLAQRPRSGADRDEINQATVRHDAIAVTLGQARAREPLPGETPLEFRKALAENFKGHSPFGKSDLRTMDGSAFSVIEARIYADAEVAGMRNTRGATGDLIEVKRNIGGRVITEHYGDIAKAFAPFIRAGIGCRLNIPK